MLERDARIKADAIAQERAAWVAQIEALDDPICDAIMAARYGSHDGMKADEHFVSVLTQLRDLLSSDATETPQT